MVEFCGTDNLIITNTLFQQHPRRLYTWAAPDGKTRNQIDYITVSQRWRSSVIKSRTYPGADSGTDHQLLSAHLKLRLKRIPQPPNPVRFDLVKLQTNKEYRVKVANKFRELIVCEEERTGPAWKSEPRL